MQPKFSVGEEVILLSRKSPQINNSETTVISIVEAGTMYSCPHCGKEWLACSPHPSVAYGYFVAIANPRDCCNSFAEDCLRKKHKPGESFDELMKGLKSPKKEEA